MNHTYSFSDGIQYLQKPIFFWIYRITFCNIKDKEPNTMNYQIHYREEVDSTNLWAKELAKQGAPEGTVTTAGSQTAGRGRRGRSWLSPPDTSIYMSLLLRPQIKPELASMLTLVMGLSTAQTIQKQTGLDAKIKWPNDIVVNKKKVCGILTEMQVFPQGIEYVIIGVGINVSQRTFPDEIANTATSLAIERELAVGKKEIFPEKAQIIDQVLECFFQNYERFLLDGSLKGLMADYNQMLVSRNREIRVLDPAGEYSGISTGINELGELLVQKVDGSVEAVYAGEVSVRGVYGYV